MGSLHGGARSPAQLRTEIAYYEAQLVKTKSPARALAFRIRLAQLRVRLVAADQVRHT